MTATFMHGDCVTIDDDTAVLNARLDRVASLPDPTALCCAVVRSGVEVLRGERPAAQLAPWVSAKVLESLAQASGTRPKAGQVSIKRLRMVLMSDDAAEAGVVVAEGKRIRAAAVRLEATAGRWHVVALEIG